MKNTAFYKMFINLLNEIYDSENQLVRALPEWIQSASHQDLKEALTAHLSDTREQIIRLKKTFSLMNVQPNPQLCQAMESILRATREGLTSQMSSTVKDAFIITCAQKVEHYEMAVYGCICAFAKHLGRVYHEVIDFGEISKLLEKTLSEKSKSDKKLTILAEGKFFTKGINDEAENELKIAVQNRL